MSIRITGSVSLSNLSFVTAPSPPIIGTATATSASSATVSFTAPASDGGSTILSYTAVSSPGGITATISQSGSGTITLTGLTETTNYTFTVYATNKVGNSANSDTSNQITTPAIIGDALYTTPGTYSWVAPIGVTSVSVVCVGGGGSGRSGWGYNGYAGGGGGGGALAWLNSYPVTPGQSYTVVVGAGGIGDTSISANDGTSGGDSYFVSSSICFAGGGKRPGVSEGLTGGGPGGTYTVSAAYGTRGGGNGGQGGNVGGNNWPGGGGGAGGYSGNGGAGSGGGTGGNGSGGGGAGGTSVRFGLWSSGPSGGGGVGLYGQGSSGVASPTTESANQILWGGGGGSGGNDGEHGRVGPGGLVSGNGGQFGGGGAAVAGGYAKCGGTGAVRIIWGPGRAFPSTSVGTTPAATGGTITTVGSYKYHKFTSSDTFTVTSPGSFDILLVAGGGGGGASSGAGGGAGGVVYKNSYFLNTGNYTLTVGAGGATGAVGGANGSNGSDTTFSTILTAYGGGFGGGGGGAASNGGNGGSGGGASSASVARTGGLALQTSSSTYNYGFGEAGGNNPITSSGNRPTAGGGGAMYGGSDGIFGPPNTGGSGGQGLALPGTMLSDASIGQLVSGTRYIAGGGRGGYTGTGSNGTTGYGGGNTYNGGGGISAATGGGGIIVIRYIY